MAFVHLYSGETLDLAFRLCDPMTGAPVRDETTYVEFALSENRFNAIPLWTGTVGHGLMLDPYVEGLVRVRVPLRVTDELRRGVYAWSVFVASRSLADPNGLGPERRVARTGYVMVDYATTSPEHDIPYRCDNEPVTRVEVVVNPNGVVCDIPEDQDLADALSGALLTVTATRTGLTASTPVTSLSEFKAVLPLLIDSGDTATVSLHLGGDAYVADSVSVGLTVGKTASAEVLTRHAG